MSIVFNGVKNYHNLDYVSAWFFKSANYINETNISVGFVSTNSIVQGQQAILIWKELINNRGIYINTAHRTFVWGNKAKNKAAVHVVIICFSQKNERNKLLFEYIEGKGEPITRKVEIINQYLARFNHCDKYYID